mgnify:FL=1|tara:strand:+ start:41432 stop:42106 length:675 start_codon:yes stop_codon:yes gene_type:complete
MKKILVVDDDKDIIEILSYNLRKEGFLVETARDGNIALEKAKVFIPDLIILDVMMPNLDGIETCRSLREIPEIKDKLISFLTARNEDYSQIAGLEAGADDYIYKPIRPKVLVSKVKSLLRRNTSKIDQLDVINFKDIQIDRLKYKVYKNGEKINFAKKEYDLLLLLFSDPGKLFKRNEIMLKVWGNESYVGDRTIDVHIRKLRKKLGEDLIITIKGIGYQINEL